MSSSKLIGGKAASLVLLAETMPTPKFSILESDVFELFITESGLGAGIDKYWSASIDPGLSGLIERVRETMIKHCLQYPFSQAVNDRIEKVWHTVATSPVISRSSASCEDGSIDSWAGMFVSQPSIHTLEQWKDAVRTTWAALFTPRIASYARMKRALNRPKISVIAQAQIAAVASGVVFTQSPTSGQKGPILEAAPGQGVGLVSGLVSPERWVYDRAPVKAKCWKPSHVFMRSDEGVQECGAEVNICLPSGSRLALRNVNSDEDLDYWIGRPYALLPGLAVLSEKLVAQIFDAALGRHASIGKAVEFEWCIDERGMIWWVQERPITALDNYESSRETSLTPQNLEGVVARGTLGAPGRAAGIPVLLSDAAKRVAGSPSILVTDYTTPNDVPAILCSSGVVTAEGGLLSHTAIVCREARIPCLIDTNPFPPPFEKGETMFLDADNGLLSTLYAETDIAAADLNRGWDFCLAPIEPRVAEPLVDWRISRDLIEQVPRALKRHLELCATTAGIAGPIRAFSDINLAHPELGFPTGIAFQSRRLHPTAVGDCGDGFSVLKVCLTRDDFLRRRDVFLSKLQAKFSFRRTDSFETHSGERVGMPSLDDMGRTGLDSLSDTIPQSWKDAFQLCGRFEGGDFHGLSVVLQDLAIGQLLKAGSTGHFFEVLCPVEYDAIGGLVFVLHTGTSDFGLEFLRNSVAGCIRRSQREGQDSPDRFALGLWGVDLWTSASAELVGHYIALSNYALVRRAVILSSIVAAVQETWGACASELLVDSPHTFLRKRGDILDYHQGVQLLDSAKQIFAFIAGAPGVPSFLCTGDTSGINQFPHGKSNPALCAGSERAGLEDIVNECLFSGAAAIPDCLGKAFEETVLSARETSLAMSGGKFFELWPLLCLRGDKNGGLKIRN